MRSIVANLALLLLLLLFGHRALADSGAVIVSASSKVAERDRSLALAAAENRLRAAGWDLASKPFTEREIEAITTCLHNVEAWPCVAKIVGPRGVRRVAAVALKRDQTVRGDPELVITGRVVLADVELVVLGKRFCEHCTDDTLSVLTTELTTELLQQAALESGRTVLAIKSTPQGAIYTVDGTLSSATDATITVVPGTHVVTIEHEGYQTETRTIEAIEGTTAEVMVTLRRLELLGDMRALSQYGVPHPSRALPIGLLAVGATAIAGGLLVLAFNEPDVTKPANEVQPRWHYDTIPASIISISGGAALALVGGCLWWQYSRDDAQTALSAATTVAPVIGGAVISVHGAF